MARALSRSAMMRPCPAVGRAFGQDAVHFPTIDDSVKSLAFIEAAVKSSKANGKRTKL